MASNNSDSDSEFSLMDEDEYAAQQETQEQKETTSGDEMETSMTSHVNTVEKDASPSTNIEHAITIETMDTTADEEYKKEIEQLETHISQDIYQYDAHVRLIELLRSNQRWSDLHLARERMHSIYPLTEAMWRQWIEDAVMIEQANNAATIQYGWIHDNIDKLYARAICDYLSVGLWHDRITRIIPEFNRKLESISGTFDIENSFITEIRSQLFNPALDQVMYHVAESAKVWDLIMNVEVSILKKLNSEQQFKHILAMFHQRLTIGHAELQETFYRLSPLVTEYGGDQYETIMAEASQKKQLGENAYTLREPLELQLVSSGYSQQAFEAYIAFEKKQRPPNPSYICTMYERALIYHCLNPLLWEQYLLYMTTRAESSSEDMMALCKRAIRNCPWSGELYGHYIRVLEQANVDYKHIHDIYEKARQSSVVQMNKAELVKLCLAYCSWERRRYVLMSSERQPEDLAKILGDTINWLDTLFPEGDATYSLLEFSAQVYASTLNNVDMARQCWSSIIKKRSVEADAWLANVQFEQQYGDVARVQAVFKQACFRVGDWPERVFSAWIAFEQQHGTADSLTLAYARTRHQAAVLASRLNEAVWIEQQQQQQKRNKAQEAKLLKKMQMTRQKEQQKRRLDSQEQEMDTGNEITNIESNNAEETRTKRTKHQMDTETTVEGTSSDTATTMETTTTDNATAVTENANPLAEEQPRSDKSCTVLVSPLTTSITESQLTELFKQFGEVKSVLLVREQTGESKSYGYVTFKVLAGAIKALDQGQITMKTDSTEELVIKISAASQQHANPTTLYVCNFSKQMTKERLHSYFSPYGNIVSIRLPASRQQKARQFAYIEYEQPSEAQAALVMNGQWNAEENRAWSVAISDSSRKSNRQAREQDGSSATSSSSSADARQLYVSNFPHSTTKEELVQLFGQFGGLCDVRILLNNQGKSKGCGFVEYYTQASAQAALALNAHLMGGRHLSVVPADPSKRGHGKRDTVTPPNHLTGTLRITQLPDDITEETVRDAFSLHGQVLKVKLFGHGGAMVKYGTDEEANRAVLAMNDFEIVPEHRISVMSAQQSALTSSISAITSTSTTSSTTGINPNTVTSLMPRHLSNPNQRRRRLTSNITPSTVTRSSTTNTENDQSQSESTTTATTATIDRSNDDFRKLFLQSKTK